MSDLNKNTPSTWPGTLAGFAALLAGIGFGRFAYPAFIPVLVEKHWFTIPQADYLAATALAGYVLGAFTAGHRFWKVGTSSTIRISMLIASASYLFCIKPLGFGWFFFWRLFAGVAGGFLMVTAVPAILADTPAKQRGRASGVIFTGVGAGIAAAGTIVPMLARRGLAQAWVGVGIASFILTILTWRYWQNVAKPGIEKRSQSRPARFEWSIVFLMAAYCASAAGFVPHSVFWVDFIARGLQRGLAAGGHYWVLVGLSAAAGPMVAGCAADRVGFARSLRWALLVEAFGVALPVFSRNGWSLALSSVVVGSMAMGITSLAAGRVSELVAIQEQKQVWSWMTTAFSITYTAGAWSLSFLFARTRTYGILFEIGATALLAGFLLDAAGLRTVPAGCIKPAPEEIKLCDNG